MFKKKYHFGPKLDYIRSNWIVTVVRGQYAKRAQLILKVSGNTYFATKITVSKRPYMCQALGCSVGLSLGCCKWPFCYNCVKVHKFEDQKLIKVKSNPI